MTSTLLQAIPPHITYFDAQLSAVVPRAPGRERAGQYGGDVRLDPCTLDWESKTITIHIPLAVNPGVTGLEDLDPDCFEALQAAFLSLMLACC